ncbi:unnamed protein product [Eruca vesicaria subsp. sativa]|uniref:Pre-SET domain-containing protein n=1 Tax=Eruca vesicaria subsp. sativa TaxID=29727 RepID=A0ABC8LEW6_ERUVS|nr:unnamed protein product [Eruca vesicaria subsp. sativa]
MEGNGSYADKTRVLDIKPLRTLRPVFPSGNQAPPFVCAPPFGPFPPGFSPFYPFSSSQVNGQTPDLSQAQNPPQRQPQIPPQTQHQPQIPPQTQHQLQIPPQQQPQNLTEPSLVTSLRPFRSSETSNGENEPEGSIVKRKTPKKRQLSSVNFESGISVAERDNGNRELVMSVLMRFDALRRRFAQLEDAEDAIQKWKTAKSFTRKGLILPDLTSGVENIAVSLVNEVDNENGPGYFTYSTTVKYSMSFQLTQPSSGCACGNKCKPGNLECHCIRKNGAMEGNFGSYTDKTRVLDIKPLRTLRPVFPSGNQAPPFVCAPPFGPFPPGFSPFYPFSSSQAANQHTPDLNQAQYPTPHQHQAQNNSEPSLVTPLRTFRSPDTTTSNGDVEPEGSTVKRKIAKKRTPLVCPENFDSGISVAEKENGNRKLVMSVVMRFDALRRRFSQLEDAKETVSGAIKRPDLKAGSTSGVPSREGLILSDLTSGVESIGVSLVNDVDAENGPPYFTYSTTVNYSDSFKLTQPSIGCDCSNSCKPGNLNCHCIRKNGGMIF